MSRVQLALRVSDLEGSIAFYSSLFGVEPAKRRRGYANFAVTEPALKLVLIEGEPDGPTVMDHLGVEVETTDEVNDATARLSELGLFTQVEDNTTCRIELVDHRRRHQALDNRHQPALPAGPTAGPGWSSPSTPSAAARPRPHRRPAPPLEPGSGNTGAAVGGENDLDECQAASARFPRLG